MEGFHMTEELPVLVNEIRCLETRELYRCRECFFNFFNESQLPGKPDFSHWTDCWTYLIENKIGYLIASINGYEIKGVIGGMYYPCMLTKEQEMVEAFWWVKPLYRNGPTGVKLLKYFEKLSKDLGAKRIKMIYMCHLNSKIMASIYDRMDYKQIEIGYMKEVV